MPVVCVLREHCAKHKTEQTRLFSVLEPDFTFQDLEEEYACDRSSLCRVALSKSADGPWTELANNDNMYNQKVADVIEMFDCKFMKIMCDPKPDSTFDPEISACSSSDVSQDPKQTEVKDAFAVLMASTAKKKSLPGHKTASSGVKEGLSSKDELYNELVNLFRQNGAAFHNPDVEGKYIIQVLANALWYVTNQHEVIRYASTRQSSVTSIPVIFDSFQGYNAFRRKRLKEHPMEASVLDSHAQALFSICTRPSMSSSDNSTMRTEITKLAECLNLYSKHLVKKKLEVQTNQGLMNPVREVSDNTSVRTIPGTRDVADVRPEYRLLDAAVSAAEILGPIFFDEDLHIIKPFQNTMQRMRYFENLQLSIPVDLYKYSPGGNILTTHCIIRITGERTERQKLTDVAQCMANIKDRFPVYHTRQMKRDFRTRLSNIASLKPAVMDFIYKELSLDASCAVRPEVAERLRMISLGETGLIGDLRHLNPGRPTGAFDTFFEHLGNIVNEITAADERRHNVAHFSEWLSLGDLVRQAAERCPEGTAIPSKSLVRIQFSPRNPYSHAAMTFTSRFEVQYKIQRRQLRVSHIDAHYAAALFKYLRHFAILLKEDCILFCADDKAKVPIGEPGVPSATGVRGKKVLAPSETTIAAVDHDLSTKGSIIPSVYLQCSIPDTVDKSFYRGTVSVTLNDAVFQQSNPFRHAAALVKIIKDGGLSPKFLLKYTDGGTDHRNTLESVKCAAICIFKELDLDMLVAARCAPGHSWSNPAERVMSLLNIGIQNCALERTEIVGPHEKSLKSCSGMKDIRQYGEKNPEFKELWAQSLESTIACTENRFRRLALKGEPVQIIQSIDVAQIDYLQRHLNYLFPDMDLDKSITKLQTNKLPAYLAWLEKHTKQDLYCFQIRKCGDEECCTPTRSTIDLHWLPCPMLDATKEHFKNFSEVYRTETTECDRPSFQVAAVKGPGKASKKSIRTAAVEASNNIIEDPQEESLLGVQLTAQIARLIIDCVECRKPRVVYSKLKLSERQKTSFALLASEWEFSCGSPVTPPNHSLHKVLLIKTSSTCESPVEAAYYSSAIGRPDICYYCGVGEAQTDQELKKSFKTVFPICVNCKKVKPAACLRPYGKSISK